MVLEYIDKGMEYVQIGLSWIRDILTKASEWLPWGGELTLTILFLAASLLGGHFIVKRFVVKPFQFSYLPWTLLISALIYLCLMYL